MNLGLALKYRPRRFAELVGQRHVSAVLRELAKGGTPPQQLLLSGGSGLGKTTVARIFAAALLCENPVDGDACGLCVSCLDITAPDRTHPDVIELDAASHGGKDEIQEMAQRARTLPMVAQYKIYIVDEAHGLSRAGGEAFLKLLEEPPSHVLFFLATTDPDKMLATNRGRCLELPLSSPSETDIAQQLVHIAEQEGWNLSETAALAVVQSADSALGVRGAVMALAKLQGPLTRGEELTQDVLSTYLGVLPSREILYLADALNGHDPKLALDILEGLNARFGDKAIRDALASWATSLLKTPPSFEMGLFYLELLASTPPGALWTRTVVARLASPALDGSPAALAALVEKAGEVSQTLEQLLKKVPTTSHLTASPDPKKDNPATPPAEPSQANNSPATSTQHPRPDTDIPPVDAYDDYENYSEDNYNEYDTPHTDTQNTRPPQARNQSGEPKNVDRTSSRTKMTPTKKAAKKAAKKAPTKASTAEVSKAHPTALTATLDTAKARRDPGTATPKVSQTTPPTNAGNQQNILKKGAQPGNDPWFDNPDAYDTSPLAHPPLPPTTVQQALAAVEIVDPSAAGMLAKCEMLLEDGALYVIVPRALANKMRTSNIRPVVDDALKGFPTHYRVAAT